MPSVPLLLLPLSLPACFDDDPVELSDEIVAQAIQDVEAQRRFALARDAERDRPLTELVGADTVLAVQAAADTRGLTPAPVDLAGRWTGTLARPGWSAAEVVEREPLQPGIFAIRSTLELTDAAAPGTIVAVVQQRGVELWADGQLCRWFDWHYTATRDPELEWTLFAAFAEDKVNGRPCFQATLGPDGSLSFVDDDDRWTQRRLGGPSSG